MKVGSLVECINGEFHPETVKLCEMLPVKGKMYLVRQVNEYQSVGKVGILLEEILNPTRVFKNITLEPDFSIDRFREIADIPDMEAIMEELEEIFV